MYNGIALVHYGIAEVILAEIPEDSVGTWVGGRRQQMAVPLSLSPHTDTCLCSLAHTCSTDMAGKGEMTAIA